MWLSSLCVHLFSDVLLQVFDYCLETTHAFNKVNLSHFCGSMGNCFSCIHSKSTTRPVAHSSDSDSLENVPNKRIEGESVNY